MLRHVRPYVYLYLVFEIITVRKRTNLQNHIALDSCQKSAIAGWLTYISIHGLPTHCTHLAGREHM